MIKGQSDQNEQEKRKDRERERKKKKKAKSLPTEGSRGAITISKRRKLKPHCWEPNSAGGAAGGLTREELRYWIWR